MVLIDCRAAGWLTKGGGRVSQNKVIVGDMSQIGSIYRAADNSRCFQANYDPHSIYIQPNNVSATNNTNTRHDASSLARQLLAHAFVMVERIRLQINLIPLICKRHFKFNLCEMVINSYLHSRLKCLKYKNKFNDPEKMYQKIVNRIITCSFTTNSLFSRFPIEQLS